MFRIGRKILFTGLLGSAIGAPYLATKAGQTQQAASGMWSNMFQAVSLAPNPYGEKTEEPTREPYQPKLADMPLEGLDTHDLGEVLRFDVSPDWVYQRWARKTTALSDLNLFGIRVPLVTGTGVHDVAGSLTYYFNNAGQVERITFRGRTGDARPLIALSMTRFGLMRQTPQTPGELLYEVRWNGRAMSRLRLNPASVIWASVPHATYAIDLDLNRPGAARYLQEPLIAPGPVPVHEPLRRPMAPR